MPRPWHRVRGWGEGPGCPALLPCHLWSYPCDPRMVSLITLTRKPGRMLIANLYIYNKVKNEAWHHCYVAVVEVGYDTLCQWFSFYWLRRSITPGTLFCNLNLQVNYICNSNSCVATHDCLVIKFLFADSWNADYWSCRWSGRYSSSK